MSDWFVYDHDWSARAAWRVCRFCRTRTKGSLSRPPYASTRVLNQRARQAQFFDARSGAHVRDVCMQGGRKQCFGRTRQRGCVLRVCVCASPQRVVVIIVGTRQRTTTSVLHTCGLLKHGLGCNAITVIFAHLFHSECNGTS